MVVKESDSYMNVEPVLSRKILKCVPHKHPFLFIDKLISIKDDEVVGEYTFKEEEFFYRGHFPGNPITPGVILTEAMGQIGILLLGIYLSGAYVTGKITNPILTHCDVDFIFPVLPGDTIRIHSKKKYYRAGILSCKVELYVEEKIAATGTISGMI